jgi:hypothetical protein
VRAVEEVRRGRDERRLRMLRFLDEADEAVVVVELDRAVLLDEIEVASLVVPSSCTSIWTPAASCTSAHRRNEAANLWLVTTCTLSISSASKIRSSTWSIIGRPPTGSSGLATVSVSG